MRYQVTGSAVQVHTPDGVADCYLAAPDPADGGGPFPGVLMFMDVLGIRPSLTGLADTIAADGYLVLVPNLFYRHGPARPAELGDLTDLQHRASLVADRLRWLSELDRAEAMADTGAYLDALQAHPAIAPGPVGLSGHCMGGMLGLHAAGAYPDRIGVLGSAHGGDLATTEPDSPHLRAGRIRAQVYIAHADQDPSAPPEQQQRLAQALDAAGVDYRAEVYSGCGHGFTVPDSPAYDASAAGRYLDELLTLLGGLSTGPRPAHR